ncbi:heme ABC exporter ATP-binding protein CcmA [bacterium]|nr:heme ABC exporter ATP-binding protein CcmA [bacterium]
MTILKCEELELKVGYKTLIRNFSLELAAGESVAVVGPNGLGKTTLLRTLCGVGKPYRGRVSLGGKNIWPQVDDSKSSVRICYLASQPALFLDHTVSSNLEFYVRSHSMSWDLNRGKEALESAGLTGRLQQTVRTLSTGQKRRLTLAFMSLVKPELLLLDEPTNGLDTDGVALCLRLMSELRSTSNSAILIATHDQQLIDWCGKSVDLKRWAP